MKFDSHLVALLEAAVGLSNVLVAGQSAGRDYQAPEGRARDALICDLLTPAAGPRPTISPADGDRLAETAGRLRQVFASAAAGEVAAAAKHVNRLLRESGARPQLDRDPVEGWHVHFHASDDTVVLGWTAGCATALALALGSDLAGRLGVCSAVRCDRVYVDTSRNAGRRFCSTSCQNRTKAAAFRARESGRA